MSASSNESLIDSTDMAGRVSVSSPLGVSASRSKSLVEGLRALVEETDSARSRVPLRQLIERLDRGEAPAVATAALAKSLPASLRVLLTATDEIGRAELVLPRIVQQMLRVQELRADVWRRLLLPLYYFAGAGAVALMALLVAAPMMMRFYLGEGYLFDVMPPSTRAIGWICHAAADYPVALTAALLASLLIAVRLLRSTGDRLSKRPRRGFWSGPACTGPSSLFRKLAYSEFFHLLAAFLDAGMSVPSAVRRAAEIDPHAWLREQGLRFANDLDQGVAPDFAVQVNGLPWSLAHLLRDAVPVAAQSEALRELGDVYALRAEEQSSTVAAVLVPVGLVLSAMMLLAFLLALLGPFLFPLHVMLS